MIIPGTVVVVVVIVVLIYFENHSRQPLQQHGHQNEANVMQGSCRRCVKLLFVTGIDSCSAWGQLYSPFPLHSHVIFVSLLTRLAIDLELLHVSRS